MSLARMASLWRTRNEPEQGPRRHRCGPNALDRAGSGARVIWHPDGIGPGEPGYRGVLCPECGDLWSLQWGDGFPRWHREGALTGITVKRCAVLPDGSAVTATTSEVAQ